MTINKEINNTTQENINKITTAVVGHTDKINKIEKKLIEVLEKPQVGILTDLEKIKDIYLKEIKIDRILQDQAAFNKKLKDIAWEFQGIKKEATHKFLENKYFSAGDLKHTLKVALNKVNMAFTYTEREGSIIYKKADGKAYTVKVVNILSLRDVDTGYFENFILETSGTGTTFDQAKQIGKTYAFRTWLVDTFSVSTKEEEKLLQKAEIYDDEDQKQSNPHYNGDQNPQAVSKKIKEIKTEDIGIKTTQQQKVKKPTIVIKPMDAPIKSSEIKKEKTKEDIMVQSEKVKVDLKQVAEDKLAEETKEENIQKILASKGKKAYMIMANHIKKLCDAKNISMEDWKTKFSSTEVEKTLELVNLG